MAKDLENGSIISKDDFDENKLFNGKTYWLLFIQCAPARHCNYIVIAKSQKKACSVAFHFILKNFPKLYGPQTRFITHFNESSGKLGIGNDWYPPYHYSIFTVARHPWWFLFLQPFYWFRWFIRGNIRQISQGIWTGNTNALTLLALAVQGKLVGEG